MRTKFPQSQTYRVAVLCGGDSDERAISLESGRCVADALRERGHEVTLIDPAVTPPEAALFRDVDVAFLALHGRNGEDGTIQSVLDRMGVVFTGSGAEASRLAFSKSASKERFFQCGVPTPVYVLVHESDGDQRVPRTGRSHRLSARRQTRLAGLEPGGEHRALGRRSSRGSRALFPLRLVRALRAGRRGHRVDAAAVR